MPKITPLKSSIIRYKKNKNNRNWVLRITVLLIIWALILHNITSVNFSLAAPENQLQTACYEDICISYDQGQLGDLFGGWVGESEIAGIPVPEHIRFWFPNYPLPAAGEWFAAIDFHSTGSVDYSGIEMTLFNQPNVPPAIYEEITDLYREPFPVGNAMLSLVANFRFFDFQSGSGYRYVGEYGQAIAPTNPDQLLYIYQGLSSDGRYAVSALLMVALPIAPGPDAPQIDDEVSVREYNRQWAELIEQDSGDGFIPSLYTLDEVIQSITIGSVTSPVEEVPIPLPLVSSVDLDEARQWIGEKRQLTMDLENANIPTRIFTVPALRAYDEYEAHRLVDEFSAALDQGNLSLEQLEQLKRLTIQERMMQQMLSPYIESSSTVSKTSVDSIKTVLSFNKALRLAWDRCGGFACGKLQEAANKLAWNVIRKLGKQFIRAGNQAGASNDQMSLIWEAGIMGVQQLVDKNSSPIDLLYDTGAEFSMTNLLIQPYLDRTQSLIDRGVITARDPNQVNTYLISGEAERASSLLDELVQKAQWESDLAVSRHQDFKNAADLAQIFQDITDIGSIINPLFTSVSIGARIEKLIVDGVLLYLNFDNMGCIEYLASRGAEIAFDADQPAEDCRYWRASDLSAQVASTNNTYLISVKKSPIYTALDQETQEYQQALIDLVSAMSTNNQTTIDPAIQKFMDVQERLSNTLDSSQAILTTHENLLEEDFEAISQFAAFDISNMVVYLAIAETTTSKEAGNSPETDLSLIAQQNLNRLNNVQQMMGKVDLTPPAEEPLIVIRDAFFGALDNGRRPLQVKIQNLGGVRASDLSIVIEGGISPETKLISVAAQGEENIKFDSVYSEQAEISVKVFSAGELQDFYLVTSPDQYESKEHPITKPIRTDQGASFPFGKIILYLGGLFLMVGMIGLIAGILGLRKSNINQRR